MRIGNFYNGVEIHREEKILYARFLSPHRVISTCPVNGGLREDLNGVLNHQSCEPQGHYRKATHLAFEDPPQYLKALLGKYRLKEAYAALNTAANMHCAVIESSRFRDLEVVTVCTAGVESNAGRAGDPATIYESGGRFEPLVGDHFSSAGTINIMLFINREIAPSALTLAVITATEAKTAVMAELNVNSRYSDRIATGTGTDQMAVASRMGDAHPLSGAGKHCKLGEIIGQTVISAIKQSLSLQNSLSPLSQRSVKIHIERLGCDRQLFVDGVCRFLDAEEAAVFRDNFGRIDRDPVTVAAAAALVHLRDKFIDGILPASCQPEIVSTFGAHLSAAVSGKFARVETYRRKHAENVRSLDSPELLEFIYRCIALGFEDKWR